MVGVVGLVAGLVVGLLVGLLLLVVVVLVVVVLLELELLLLLLLLLLVLVLVLVLVLLLLLLLLLLLVVVVVVRGRRRGVMQRVLELVVLVELLVEQVSMRRPPQGNVGRLGRFRGREQAGRGRGRMGGSGDRHLVLGMQLDGWQRFGRGPAAG